MVDMDEVVVKRRVSFKKIFLFILCVVIVIVGIFLYSRFIATSGLRVHEIKISSSKIPDSFYGAKIVHISDVHYGRTVNLSRLEDIVNKVNLLKPDIVVLTGDFLDKDVKLGNHEVNDIVKVLSKIDATLGKYAISGNHDVRFDEWSTIMKNSEFMNLNDTYTFIYYNGYEPIMIAGLSSNLDSSKVARDKIKPVNDYIDSIKDSEDATIPKYKILLLHEPDYVDSITSSNYDLILAGHSHNGQVRLPFIGATIKPNGAKKYYDSYYELGNTQLFISNGIGTSNYNFRLFNRPSINFYRLVN